MDVYIQQQRERQRALALFVMSLDASMQVIVTS
jgi:hypothetical protein